MPLGVGWAWLQMRSRQLPDLASATLGQDALHPRLWDLWASSSSVGVSSRTGLGGLWAILSFQGLNLAGRTSPGPPLGPGHVEGCMQDPRAQFRLGRHMAGL